MCLEGPTSLLGAVATIKSPKEAAGCILAFRLLGLALFADMGFTKIMGTFLEGPIIRIVIFWGLCWGSPI